jgi:hypothetical protein
MDGRITVLSLLLAVVACSTGEVSSVEDHAATAESFFRSVYGCASESLEELANPNVVVSYPIFDTLYDTPVIRGRAAVLEFSRSFCRRWGETSISVDEVINDDDRVVLVWSFSAGDQRAEDSSQARQSWGGISVFSFDDSGRVIQEVGEESSPGPTARLGTSPTL